MIPKKWSTKDWFTLTDSIQKHWKIDNLHTHCPIQPQQYNSPFFINNIGPILTQIIRKKYRIQSLGFVCKVQIRLGRKTKYTDSFIKEISLDTTKQSPFNELYATLCASYLRQNKKTPGLPFCYGFVSGTLKYFTIQRHKSSVEDVSNPTQFGFRIKKKDYKYAHIERVNEPTYLLSQEYYPLTIDDIFSEWKNDNLSESQLILQVTNMLLQITTGLYEMDKEWGIHHNDLHLGNIMARKDPSQPQGYRWGLIDWGRCTIQRNGC